MNDRTEEHRWIVDSIEELVASVEVDGERMMTVPLWMLPDGARQGHVLAVRHARPSKGQRSVLTVEIDEAATAKAERRSAQQVAMHDKQPNDPGGDITL